MLGNILMIFSHKLDLSSTCTLIPLLSKVLFGSISITMFTLLFSFLLLIDLTHFRTKKSTFKIGSTSIKKSSDQAVQDMPATDLQYENSQKVSWNFVALNQGPPPRRITPGGGRCYSTWGKCDFSQCSWGGLEHNSWGG